MTKAGKTTRLALTLAAAMLALPAIANADKGKKARPTLIAKADTRDAKVAKRSQRASKKAPAKAKADKAAKAAPASDNWLDGLYGDTNVVEMDTAAAPAPKAKAGDGLESLSAYAKGSASGFALRGRLRGAPEYEEIEKFDAKSLDRRAINKVVERNRDKIHYCYTRIAGRGKAPNGEVTVHFVVEAKGKVKNVEVVAAKGKKGKQLEKCMTRFIKRWKFPTADAQTVVDYPFVFDVGGSTLSED